MRKSLIVIGLSVLPTAPVVAQEFDPVGRWTFHTVIDGDTLPGWMEVTRAEGHLYAKFQVEGQPELPALSLDMHGTRMTVTAEIPDAGELLVELVFTGDEFTGEWSMGYDGAEVWGKRATG